MFKSLRNARMQGLTGSALLALVTALLLPLQLFAQALAMHHHYKLIDLGTFGGPKSYTFENYTGPIQNLNNQGMFVGWADTSTPDPNPNFCFNNDCYVSHAFQWKNGVRTDLGTLPHGASSAATWVSANGLIAGASQNGQTDPLTMGILEVRAVLWRDGRILDLGTLPEGGYESGAEAVNSRGQVVGWANNTVPDPNSLTLTSNFYNSYAPEYAYQERAFLWQDGVMQDLGTLGTGTDAYAFAINEQGQVIGISYTDSTPNQVPTLCGYQGTLMPTQDPFLWENGKMIDLGSLGGTCGWPTGINSWGQVVGQSDLPGDLVQHSFFWTKERGMQDLGLNDGRFVGTNLYMINDLGEAVGGAGLASNNQIVDAVIWNGTWRDLGTIDDCAVAWWINLRGQVVGDFGGTGPNPCEQGGFLWENGGPMVDLNTLVVANNGFTIVGDEQIYINDQGEIAGRGLPAGCDSTDACGHDYVLIPCDENHPDIEGCDYSLVESAKAAEAHAAQTTKAPEAAVSPTKTAATKIMNRFRSMMSSRKRNFGPLQQQLAWGAH